MRKRSDSKKTVDIQEIVSRLDAHVREKKDSLLQENESELKEEEIETLTNRRNALLSTVTFIKSVCYSPLSLNSRLICLLFRNWINFVRIAV